MIDTLEVDEGSFGIIGYIDTLVSNRAGLGATGSIEYRLQGEVEAGWVLQGRLALVKPRHGVGE